MNQAYGSCCRKSKSCAENNSHEAAQDSGPRTPRRRLTLLSLSSVVKRPIRDIRHSHRCRSAAPPDRPFAASAKSDRCLTHRRDLAAVRCSSSNVRSMPRIQRLFATHWANSSAGISSRKVVLVRSLSCLVSASHAFLLAYRSCYWRGFLIRTNGPSGYDCNSTKL